MELFSSKVVGEPDAAPKPEVGVAEPNGEEAVRM
jgi:hypothetical protein